MGRSPSGCCKDISVIKRGAWSAHEDMILREYITREGRWNYVPIEAGLNRSGKSCRLRWLNYLRPDIKHGNISADEEELIIRLHGLLGNRWSLIAGRLSGRTDNEIKNYWNTKLSKKCLRHNQPNKKLNLAHSEDNTRVHKSAPIKTKAVRLSRCCNRNEVTASISDHQDLNSPVGDKIMKNSKLSEEKLWTENESGFMDIEIQKSSAQLEFPSMQNIDQFSQSFMPNLVESPLEHSKHVTENESEASGNSLNFNQMQNVDVDFLSCPNYNLDNLSIDARPASSLEYGMDGIYTSSQQYDWSNWLNELQYL